MCALAIALGPFAVAYVDTFNSIFGAGWKHDAGKVAHSRNGAFCYSFVPQFTPIGYPLHVLRPAGNGQRHRVTVMGPGVTPVIQWEGPALGSYDPQQDASFDALFDRIVGADDRVCVPSGSVPRGSDGRRRWAKRDTAICQQWIGSSATSPSEDAVGSGPPPAELALSLVGCATFRAGTAGGTPFRGRLCEYVLPTSSPCARSPSSLPV